jgi:hypothetical protein
VVPAAAGIGGVDRLGSSSAFRRYNEPSPLVDLPVPHGNLMAGSNAFIRQEGDSLVLAEMTVDNRKAADPIDLYNPTVISTDPIALGQFELGEGEHKLTVEITGANEEAKKAYMFGLDKLIIKRLK